MNKPNLLQIHAYMFLTDGRTWHPAPEERKAFKKVY